MNSSTLQKNALTFTSSTINSLPQKPGCYLFFDKHKNIIYIGKAKDLQKRVSSYFKKKDVDAKTTVLVSKINTINFIQTTTEIEALLLENNLIKKHQPKYNINLKDSKRYAYLQLTDEDYPRLRIARQKTTKGEYFGPFVSAELRDYIKDVLVKQFQLRTCRVMPKKACLRYHIGICTAPCQQSSGNGEQGSKNQSAGSRIQDVVVGEQGSGKRFSVVGEHNGSQNTAPFATKEEYAKQVDAVRFVLKNNTSQLKKTLTQKMKRAAKNTSFEQAITFRNQLYALETIKERQQVERTKHYDEDILDFIVDKETVYLILFHIKKGILLDKEEFVFSYEKNFLQHFLMQYYQDQPIPKEIILPIPPNPLVSQALSKKRKSKVAFHVPKKGDKKQLLDMVQANIKATFFAQADALNEIKKAIGLQEAPTTIECFDISHISGTSTVASMVQFKNALPNKSAYRRYKIKTVNGNDDFASMAEVITRRYKKLLAKNEPLPDLIVIDGGKGQLSSASSALDSVVQELGVVGVRIPIISLAKKEEELFLPQKSDSIQLPKSNKGLQLLQRIRDEAHRFAIAYNRLLRKKKLFEK
ncbi:MAG: excinuclease ABC subunit UvrC [Candidatus Nanoarchaeia archaeon]